MVSRKLPYYQLELSSVPFKGNILRFRRAERGCVPLDSPSGISFDRSPPGAKKPSSIAITPDVHPKKTSTADLEGRPQKHGHQVDDERPAKRPDTSTSPKPMVETCENPPVFDLQDIPDVMERMQWPIAAALARSWFGREKHIYNNDAASVQPIDDTTITLDWALRFGRVRQRYEQLLSKDIYSQSSLKVLRNKIGRHLREVFSHGAGANLSFNTGTQTNDLRQFASDWQFQFRPISIEDTTDRAAMTDLTGALANFQILAAVGNVAVHGERYHRYDNLKRTKTFCLDARAEITHVFVYIKDNYSFNDASLGGKSQYLGHWNKTGVIVTLGAMFSDRMGGTFLGMDLQPDLGGAIEDRSSLHAPYLTEHGLELLVDTRRGWFRRLRDRDIYFPVFNKTYNEWRELHQQGGDFMVYSKPKYLKLKQPIKIELETLCRAPEPM
jgi:hypothetical protein